MLEFCLIDTAIGPVGLAWSEHGLVRLQLPGPDRAATVDLLTGRADAVAAEPPVWLNETVERLRRYFEGEPIDLSASPLDLDGVPAFHRRLYLEMLKLGWGETVTYGELAERVGAPGTAQAVGQAMGRNPVAVIVPCHRVLASGNKMGGFSAPGGTQTKRKLLEMEGVSIGAPRGQTAFAF